MDRGRGCNKGSIIVPEGALRPLKEPSVTPVSNKLRVPALLLQNRSFAPKERERGMIKQLLSSVELPSN